MSRKARRLDYLIYSFLAFLSAAFGVLMTQANAAPTYVEIPTNFGGGADAEVREDTDSSVRPNLDSTWGPLLTPRGRNRGGINGSQLQPGGDLTIADVGGMELASRVRDLTANPNTDRTSAMYLKFDISNISQADLDHNQFAGLRLTIRNANQIGWSQIYAINPYYGPGLAQDSNPDFVAFKANTANYTRVKFNIFGLKPEGMAAADPRRFGNNDPSLPVPNYNWIENPSVNGDPFPEGGTNTSEAQSLDETTWDTIKSPLIGPIGPLTWYNAPGITPDSRSSPAQDPGKYNFNNDLELLGTMTLPDPPGLGPPTPNGGTRLPVGAPILFNDDDGNLHSLVQRAKNEGRTFITVVVAFGLNGFQNTSPETAQTTPNSFLNFNYLVNPKEMDSRQAINTPNDPGLQLNDDPSWDPDGGGVTGPLPPTGSPYSCDGQPPNPNSTNCVGHSIGNNDDGHFSPTLLLFTPEPGSFVLAMIALCGLTAAGRRRK